MIQVFFIKPLTSLEKISEMPLELFDSLDISLGMGLSSKARMVINQSLEEYYTIFANQINSGIRIIEKNKQGLIIFDIAFFKDTVSESKTTSGLLTVNLISSINLLNRTQERQINYFSTYSGSSLQFLNSLSSGVEAQIISQDEDLSINTGKLQNIELIDLVLEKSGKWTWIDGGVNSQNQTILKYGDFTMLNSEGYATNEPSDNIFNIETIPIVGIPTIQKNNDIITYLLAIGNISTGSSADKEASVFLDNPGASFVIPDYPLVDLGETTENGQTIYRILNQPAFSETSLRILGSYDVSLSSNQQNNEGEQVFNYFEAQKNLYFESITKLKKDNYGISYNFPMEYPRLYLPGTPILVNYTNTIKINNQESVRINFQDQIVYLNTINYDILKQASKPGV